MKHMKNQFKPTIGPTEFIDKVIRRDENGEPLAWRLISGACPRWVMARSFR